MRKFLFWLLISYTTFLQAQLKNFPDCKTAQNLNITRNGKVGVFPSPNGPGEVNEIRESSKSLYYFEKEHHSSWFKFKVSTPDQFVFEIIPEDPKDDYDFILFKVEAGTEACEQIRLKKIKPLRSNIAHGNETYEGKTGLTLTAQSDFKSSGKGFPYSSSIAILPNEMYYLVIDRYNNSDKGFSINLNYQKKAELSGTISDDNKKSIRAEITLSNEKGEEIAKTTSDQNGKYEIKTILNSNENYLLTAYNDSSFIQSKVVRLDQLKTNKKAFQDLSMVLPKLKKGKNYVVDNLNFEPESDELVLESIPVQFNLFRLMQKNKTLSIVIEGHVNAPGQPNTQKHTDLSKKRAERVYNYLISKGIEKERLNTAWYGNTKMLFPNTFSEEEQKKNRRVEIKVLDF